MMNISLNYKKKSRIYAIVVVGLLFYVILTKNWDAMLDLRWKYLCQINIVKEQQKYNLIISTYV